MDLLVLRQQLQLFTKRRHFLGQDGENVLFFNGVVHGEVVAELLAHAEELPDGHVAGTLLGFARGVQDVPGCAEVGVEVVHVVGHAVELTEFGG
jgi:hypothetical protein